MGLHARKKARRTAAVIFAVLTAAFAAGVYATAYFHHTLSEKYPLQTVLIILETVVLFAVLSLVTARALLRGADPDRPRWFWPVMSGALTLAVTLVSYAFVGMWPIGQNTCVMSDMYSQYMPLLAYYRRALLGQGGNLINSAAMGMSLSMVPTVGYYLASPLNVLCVLFPQEYLAECFLTIITLKTVISAITFAACIQYLSGRRSVVSAVTGLLFATSMYFVAYSWNLMWFDVIMVLPLAVIALERLLRGGKPVFYILVLAYALFSNFYAAYMLCLFLILYFFVWCIREKCGGRRFWGRLVRFGVCSVIGSCLAGFLVIPTWLGLKVTSAAGESIPTLKANFELLELLGRQFFGVTPTELQVSDLPNIACGILPMLALPLYATTSRIPLRRRLTYLGLWALLCVSMALNIPNFIWHGMHGPNGLPYRYAFLYVFVVLLMTGDLLEHLDALKPRQIWLSGAAMIVYVLVMEKVSTQELQLASIYVTAVLLVVYCAILALAAYRQLRTGAVCALLLFALSAEALFSADEIRGQLRDQGFLTNHDSYLVSNKHRLLGEMGREAAQLAREENAGFCRVDSSDRFTRMDGALYGYNGLSIFASTYYYTTTQTMSHLGFSNNTVNSHYLLGYMPTIETLLGTRYYISSFELPYEPGLEKADIRAKGEMSWILYRNDDALSVGFAGTEALRSWKSPASDPVEAQNSLYEALTGDSRQILVPNTQAEYTGGAEATITPRKNGMGILCHGAENSDPTDISLTVTTPGQVYVYVDCAKADKVEVVGACAQLERPKEPTFLNYGSAAAGDIIHIRISSDKKVSGAIYAVTLNQAVYRDAVATLKQNEIHLDSYSNTEYSGTVTAQEAGVLMTTLSYDAGWQAWVDGKKAVTYGVDGALLALDIPAGIHTVALRFRTRGLSAGLCLSLAGLAGCVLLLLLRRRFHFWPPDPENVPPFAPENDVPQPADNLPEPDESEPNLPPLTEYFQQDTAVPEEPADKGETEQ